MRNLIIIAFLALAAWQGWQQLDPGLREGVPVEVPDGPRIDTRATDEILARALRDQRGDVQVEGRGTVDRILRDDTNGSRHQRFILRLASGQTVLVAHNIDLAPRIDGLQVGDTVRFYGEYEWNARGGVIHWTHHDPQGRHPDGWLEHQGRRYQ